MTIKECRKSKGLSCVQIAFKMGIPLLKYEEYENDSSEMSIPDAKKFSKIVGVSYDDIFFGNNSI